MSKPVLAPTASPSRVASRGPMLLGIGCLGIGLWFATGAFVDLDFIHVNHLNNWPTQVIIELGIAMMLMSFGPWCLLQSVRSIARHK
jgi:hypothetical protein